VSFKADCKSILMISRSELVSTRNRASHRISNYWRNGLVGDLPSYRCSLNRLRYIVLASLVMSVCSSKFVEAGSSPNLSWLCRN
jgi:hypothetical protein